MAKIKGYGLKEKLTPVHDCVMEALLFPADKRVHRFF